MLAAAPRVVLRLSRAAPGADAAAPDRAGDDGPRADRRPRDGRGLHRRGAQLRDRAPDGTGWDGPLLRLVFSPADNVEIDLEWVAAVVTLRRPGLRLRLRRRRRHAAGEGAARGRAARTGRPRRRASRYRCPRRRPGRASGPTPCACSAQLLVSNTANRADASTPTPASRSTTRCSRPRAERLPRLRRGGGPSGDAAPRARGGGRGPRRQGDAGGRPAGRGALRRALRRREVVGDAALRRGLTHADGIWGFTAGLSFRLRGPRQGP